MRDCATRQRGLDRFIHDVDHVGRPHDALVVRGDIHEQLVQIHILLIMRSDQVVKGVTGNGEHRLAIALGVVQPIQQVNSARTRSRQAHAKPARVFGVAASRESGGFFMPNLNESDLVLPFRSDSKIPLTPSPGKPKIVSTPQSINLSISKSATVFAMLNPSFRYSSTIRHTSTGRNIGKICS